MAQLLHDNNLYKPARPDYIHFRQVSTHHQVLPAWCLLLLIACHLHNQQGSSYRWYRSLQLTSVQNNMLVALQLMGPAGIADLVTAQSDPGDWLWKTVRKGVAPAFAPQALRSDSHLCIVAAVAFVQQAGDCLSFAHHDGILAFQQLQAKAATGDCSLVVLSRLVVCRKSAPAALIHASLCGPMLCCSDLTLLTYPVLWQIHTSILSLVISSRAGTASGIMIAALRAA